jgi:hypothetical protein
MSKSKKLSPLETLKVVSELQTAEYVSALKEAADKGAKMALEVINGSTESKIS